jgi:hypothetical protein
VPSTWPWNMILPPVRCGDSSVKVGAFGAQGQERRRPPHVKEK